VRKLIVDYVEVDVPPPNARIQIDETQRAEEKQGEAK
jgi:hypothetical protein